MNTDCFRSIRPILYLCLSVCICGAFLSVTPSTASAAEESRLDSAEFIALRRGLANTQIRFAPGNSVRVAFLGGSITQMTGWRDLVCEDLQTRFPDTTFEFIQAGVASMGSTPGAFRLARDVFGQGQVDLLFVEAAVNDSTNHRSSVEHIRGMEGIVRHARTRNPAIDIIMLHFVDPEKMESCNAGQTPEVIVNHERVAEHYRLPSIDLAREVTERIAAGEFTWSGDFKNLHPSPFGHNVYLQSIQRLFDLAWAEPRPAHIADYPLPDAQLDPFSYTNGKILPIANASDLNAFQQLEHWRPDDGKGTRPGFVDVPMLVANTPGASLRFAFEGTAIGLWVAAGPDAGVIEFRIDNGPPQQMDLYTDWSAMLHLPWAYVLAADLKSTAHTLDLRVLASKPDRERGGNAVRIAHFLVND